MSKKIEPQRNPAKRSDSAGRSRIKIAFDLDGVIIGRPPLVPKRLLDWLFMGSRSNSGLHYRFPTLVLEQWFRKISHFYLFRPPMKKNIEFIQQLAKNRRYELYIVSARYMFLRKETERWMKKRGIDGIFKQIFLNFGNEQPHLFKERKLKEIKPDIFIEDDNLLADYLSSKKICKIYCLSSDKSKCFAAKKIRKISEINSQR